MSNSEKKFFNEGGIYILLVLGFSVILTIIILQIQNNSEDYLSKEYFKLKKQNYSEKIVDKLENIDENRIRPMKLSNGSWHRVPFFIYDKLEVGDSVIKKENSDSVLYLKKNGEKIFADINEFNREKYHKKFSKK